MHTFSFEGPTTAALCVCVFCADSFDCVTWKKAANVKQFLGELAQQVAAEPGAVSRPKPPLTVG